MPSPRITETRRRLRAAGDAEKAPQMQAYAKSALPFFGISAAERRKIAQNLVRAYPFESSAEWQRDVLALWREATHREERYVAIEWTEVKSVEAFQTLATVPLYEELAVTGAWWDLVDPVATHRLRFLLDRFSAEMALEMRSWSRSDDLWKRRCSILCQVGRREDTDLALLFDCIEPSKQSREFFLRKAIGWALRDYAWYDSAEIERYVAEQGDALSGLSRREALKNVGGDRVIRRRSR